MSLSKTDLKNNVFELRNGNTRIINNSGLGLMTGNFDTGNPPASASVPNIISGGVAQNKFLNWLESKITNENAKGPIIISFEINLYFLLSPKASSKIFKISRAQ